jgi:agmatinase
LTSREVLSLVRGLRDLEPLDIVAADVVEVSPAYDPSGITSVAASNISFELISLMGGRIQQQRSEDSR